MLPLSCLFKISFFLLQWSVSEEYTSRLRSAFFLLFNIFVSIFHQITYIPCLYLSFWLLPHYILSMVPSLFLPTTFICKLTGKVDKDQYTNVIHKSCNKSDHYTLQSSCRRWVCIDAWIREPTKITTITGFFANPMHIILWCLSKSRHTWAKYTKSNKLYDCLIELMFNPLTIYTIYKNNYFKVNTEDTSFLPISLPSCQPTF